jgi:hypothetical protein
MKGCATTRPQLAEELTGRMAIAYLADQELFHDLASGTFVLASTVPERV